MNSRDSKLHLFLSEINIMMIVPHIGPVQCTKPPLAGLFPQMEPTKE